MPNITSFLCVTLFSLPAFLVPAGCGGGLERSADAQQSAAPWCCDVPDTPTYTEDGYVGTSATTCTPAANGTSCPNAHAPSGPPAGYIASLEVTPQSPCSMPTKFGMGAKYTFTAAGGPDNVPLTWRGWCFVSEDSYPSPPSAPAIPDDANGDSYCIDTYATEDATSCAFTTLANFAPNRGSNSTSLWAAYCLTPADTNYVSPPQSCDPSSGDCCYAPVEVQAPGATTVTPAMSYATAGFQGTGCTPAVCSGTCGSRTDGCGGTLDCTCAAGSSCQQGQCVAPTPQPTNVPAAAGGWPLLLALAFAGVGVRAGWRRVS
jgi:hypothetical protein